MAPFLIGSIASAALDALCSTTEVSKPDPKKTFQELVLRQRGADGPERAATPSFLQDAGAVSVLGENLGKAHALTGAGQARGVHLPAVTASSTALRQFRAHAAAASEKAARPGIKLRA